MVQQSEVLDDIGEDEISPGKINNARNTVMQQPHGFLRGGPKDEKRYDKTGSFVSTPGGSRKRVKKAVLPAKGKTSPKRPN